MTHHTLDQLEPTVKFLLGVKLSEDGVKASRTRTALSAQLSTRLLPPEKPLRFELSVLVSALSISFQESAFAPAVFEPPWYLRSLAGPVQNHHSMTLPREQLLRFWEPATGPLLAILATEMFIQRFEDAIAWLENHGASPLSDRNVQQELTKTINDLYSGSIL